MSIKNSKNKTIKIQFDNENNNNIDNIIDYLTSNIDSISNIPNKLSSLSKKDYELLLDKLSTAYYHDSSLVTDDIYDLVEKYYTTKFKTSVKIGSKIKEKTKKKTDKEEGKVKNKEQVERPSGSVVLKAKLPYPMFSLDKVTDEHDLEVWKRRWPKCEFYMDDKLDGVSACYHILNGKRSLYKRGDENEGADISYLLEYLDIPIIIPDNDEKEFAIRGELVMPLKTFNDKYSEEFKNPRNMVAGLTNSKTLDIPKIKDMHFVTYQIFTKPDLDKSQQIKMLTKLGFEVTEGSIIDELTIDSLTNFLKYRKRNGKYDVDGLVITVNQKGMKFPKDSNPKHQMAFKMQGETAITTVIDVEWNPSKQGLWKPRINIQPTILSGATISWVTGNNAKYIVDNGIGPGAKVVITRSGEVIPKIINVIEKVVPVLPSNSEWNESKVELVTVEETEEQKVKKIVSFFSELGAKYLAETTIQKIYNAGFNTLKDFLTIDEDNVKQIEGFKDKSAERIVESIKSSIQDVPLYSVMAASCIFPNIGSKRLKLITEAIPNLQDINNEDELESIKEKISKIHGIKTLADVFVNNLIEFNEWLKEHNEINVTYNSEKEVISTNQSLQGETVVFSGIRNVNLQKEIERCGGRVTTAVSKQTTIVIVKDLDSETSKVTKARENGAKIYQIDEFANKYGLNMD